MESTKDNASRVGPLQLFELTIDGGIFIDAYGPLVSGDTVAMPYGIFERRDAVGPMVSYLLYDERIVPIHKAFHHLAFVFHPQVPRPLLVSLMLPSLHSISAVPLDLIDNNNTCLVFVVATPIDERSAVKSDDEHLYMIPRADSTGGENASGPNGEKTSEQKGETMALWTLEVRPQLLICPMERKFIQIQSGAGLVVSLPQSPQPLPEVVQKASELFPDRKTIDADNIACQLPFCSCEYKPSLSLHESHRRQKTVNDNLDDTETPDFFAKKDVLHSTTHSFFFHFKE